MEKVAQLQQQCNNGHAAARSSSKHLFCDDDKITRQTPDVSPGKGGAPGYMYMEYTFYTVDVVKTWKYGGIHYRNTNIFSRLIFGI